MIWPFSRHKPTTELDPTLWRQAAAGLPWLRSIDAQKQAALQTLVGEFLAHKAITPVDDRSHRTQQTVVLGFARDNRSAGLGSFG